jgi:transposase
VGHLYHTQVYDLKENRLLYSGQDRTSETLEAFFNCPGQARCQKIEAVCCEIWAPYIEVIKQRLTNAFLVFDKFHIVRHRLNAVDQVRKEEAKELKSESLILFSKTRYIWLKNPWHLTEIQKTRLSGLQRRPFEDFGTIPIKHRPKSISINGFGGPAIQG